MRVFSLASAWSSTTSGERWPLERDAYEALRSQFSMRLQTCAAWHGPTAIHEARLMAGHGRT